MIIPLFQAASLAHLKSSELLKRMDNVEHTADEILPREHFTNLGYLSPSQSFLFDVHCGDTDHERCNLARYFY